MKNNITSYLHNALHQMLTIMGILLIISSALAQGDTWTTMADMPTARYGLATSVVDGIIYAIGGTSNWEAPSLTTVEAYNPTTNTWTRKASMRTARTFLSTAVVNDKIYAIGGINAEQNGFNTMYATIEMYDPALDKWTTKADMPANVGITMFSTCVVDDIIYLIGGADLSRWPSTPTLFPTVWAYNPMEETWEQKASMSTPRVLFATGEVDGKIYAMGGTSVWEGSGLITVEVYNPIMDTWDSKADMLESKILFPGSMVSGKIYACGGLGTGFSTLQTTLEYNPDTNGWTYKADMSTARNALSTAVAGGKIYAIGGRVAVGSPGLTTVEEYSPEYAPSVFADPVLHPFGLEDFTSPDTASWVQLVDIDNDGNLEAFVLSFDFIPKTPDACPPHLFWCWWDLKFYENTSDNAAPNFEYQESFPYGIPYDSLYRPGEFIDLDGDGDQDLILQQWDGVFGKPFAYLENTGTPAAPWFGNSEFQFNPIWGCFTGFGFHILEMYMMTFVLFLWTLMPTGITIFS